MTGPPARLGPCPSHGNGLKCGRLGEPDGRIDVGDVMRQIAWYKARRMVKPDVNGDAIIDKRCVMPPPAR